MSKKFTKYNLLTIILIFITVFMVVLYLYPEPIARWLFKQQYVIKKPGTKMLLVSRCGVGEKEQSARILIALKNIGITAKLVRDFHGDNFYDRFIPDKALLAAQTMRPDFILTLERGIAPLSKIAPNYLVLDQGVTNYIGKDSNNKPFLLNKSHYEFTGLLPSFKEIDFLKQAYELSGRSYVGFNWMPTVQRTNFKSQLPQKLFYPGGDLSDNTRSTSKYKELFMRLDKTGYLEVYGKPDSWTHMPGSFKGSIPFNGVSILEINNKAGITLILHARDHLYSGVPTGRIFEAAASNTVIISDRNQFIIDNFGDNVLYIDVEQNSASLFSQIDGHMQWIFANPELAQQMAERCHKIFLDKFTLEDQMLRLQRITQ